MPCCCNKDTEIADDAELLIVKNKVPERDHCSPIFWGNGCARIHLVLLILYFAFIIFYVRVFFESDLLQNPNPLCMSLGRRLFVISAFVLAVSISVGMLFLAIVMCMKVEGFRRARFCIWLSLVGLSTIVTPLAFICTVAWGYDTNVLINGPNNTYYRCSFDLGLLDGPIISSSDITNSTDMNHTCQFWPVKQLCEERLTSFNESAPPFITINETIGAYNCLSSTSTGLDLCRTYIDSTYSVWIAVVFCFPCSFPLIWAWDFWVKNTSKLRYCEKCYDIWEPCICRKVCTCCEEYRPILIDEELRSNRTAGIM
jgi:hypothetical protein